MTKFIRFFLVDDDMDDILIFREVLQDVNPTIDFRSAADGHEALSILRTKNNDLPDVIFLDLNMPQKNGYECLEEIRNNKTLQDIPVVVFSTSNSNDSVNHA